MIFKSWCTLKMYINELENLQQEETAFEQWFKLF